MTDVNIQDFILKGKAKTKMACRFVILNDSEGYVYICFMFSDSS